MVALALPLAACLLSCLTAVRGSIHDFRNNMTPIWRLSPQRELEDEGLTVMISTYKRPDCSGAPLNTTIAAASCAPCAWSGAKRGRSPTRATGT